MAYVVCYDYTGITGRMCRMLAKDLIPARFRKARRLGRSCLGSNLFSAVFLNLHTDKQKSRFMK